MSIQEFELPDVGEGLSHGEIVRWHVAVGDTVKADQILVDVQTDKAVVEIPAPVDGIVAKLGGDPGDILPVGAVLAVFEAADGPSTAPAAAPRLAPQLAPQPVLDAARSPAPSSVPRRARASPATRKLAVELGVDLIAVAPTGSRGQVTREDVERAAAAPPAVPPTAAAARPAPAAAPPPLAPSPAAQSSAPAPGRPEGEDSVVPLQGLRRQIATTMEAAWRNVPHIFTLKEIDAGELVRARRSLNEELAPVGLKLSYLPFFVKACVAALRAHPRFNASLDMERQQIVYRHRYNIGIATATPDGLIVTVVHDAERKSVVEVAREIDELARLARERKIGLDRLSHGTFTISNYGSYGGHMGTPIIRPPEVAIAGFGRVRDAVVAVDGQPAVRSLLPLVIATDHRLNDGEHMEGFAATLANYLREPIRLLGQG